MGTKPPVHFPKGKPGTWDAVLNPSERGDEVRERMKEKVRKTSKHFWDPKLCSRKRLGNILFQRRQTFTSLKMVLGLKEYHKTLPKWTLARTSLEVQLRLHSSSAGGAGLVPGWGTINKIQHTLQHGQKKKRTSAKEITVFSSFMSHSPSPKDLKSYCKDILKLQNKYITLHRDKKIYKWIRNLEESLGNPTQMMGSDGRRESVAQGTHGCDSCGTSRARHHDSARVQEGDSGWSYDLGSPSDPYWEWEQFRMESPREKLLWVE